MKKLYENPTLNVETVSASDVIATSLLFRIGDDNEIENRYDFSKTFEQ